MKARKKAKLVSKSSRVDVELVKRVEVKRAKDEAKGFAPTYREMWEHGMQQYLDEKTTAKK